MWYGVYLAALKEACDKYESEQRLMITAEKFASILFKSAEFLKQLKTITLSHLQNLIKEVKSFNVWKNLQLQDTFGVSMGKCLFLQSGS